MELSPFTLVIKQTWRWTSIFFWRWTSIFFEGGPPSFFKACFSGLQSIFHIWVNQHRVAKRVLKYNILINTARIALSFSSYYHCIITQNSSMIFLNPYCCKITSYSSGVRTVHFLIICTLDENAYIFLSSLINILSSLINIAIRIRMEIL